LAPSTTALVAANVFGSDAPGFAADGCSASISSVFSVAAAPAAVGSVEADSGTAPSSFAGPVASGSLVAMSLPDGLGRGSPMGGTGSSAWAADCVRPA
jgi:hypothetical protein